MIKVTLDDVMGNDLDVVRAAKVSFGKDDTVEPLGWEAVSLQCVTRDQPVLTEKQKGLIRYLVRGMPTREYDDLIKAVVLDGSIEIQDALWKFRNTPIHAAPFGSCTMRFIVDAPIFVARQLVKHEYLRMSEISRRYFKEEVEYFQPKDWLSAVTDIKQGGGGPIVGEKHNSVNAMYQNATSTSNRMYRSMISAGVAPEDARMVLPLCHMTRWYWTGSLDAFMNMCKMRLDSHTQSHTRTVAQKLGEHIKQAFPQSWASYVEGDI